MTRFGTILLAAALASTASFGLVRAGEHMMGGDDPSQGMMGDHKGMMGDDHKGMMGDHKGMMGDDQKGMMGDHKGMMGDDDEGMMGGENQDDEGGE